MEIHIRSLKFNLHTNIGELNEKRLKVLRGIILSEDFNTEQPGPSNIVVFTNPDSKQALLISDSQIHFSFDECSIDLVDKYISTVNIFVEKIFDCLLLDDKFNFNLEIIGEVPIATGRKKAALDKSIEGFTSASRATLKENLKEIEIVGLRFANKIDDRSYDSRVEPLTRDNNCFYISQSVSYTESKTMSDIGMMLKDSINYFNVDFFEFLKNNFLI